MKLTDLQRKSQNDPTSLRYWFTEGNFELIIWTELNHHLRTFQFCYDRGKKERVLSWNIDLGFKHYKVDSGCEDPLANQCPILVHEEEIDIDLIKTGLGLFKEKGNEENQKLFKAIEESLTL